MRKDGSESPLNRLKPLSKSMQQTFVLGRLAYHQRKRAEEGPAESGAELRRQAKNCEQTTPSLRRLVGVGEAPGVEAHSSTKPLESFLVCPRSFNQMAPSDPKDHP